MKKNKKIFLWIITVGILFLGCGMYRMAGLKYVIAGMANGSAIGQGNLLYTG